MGTVEQGRSAQRNLLVRALARVVTAIAAGTTTIEDALKGSFEDAVDGLSAEKAIFLRLDGHGESGHLELRAICSTGLSADEIRACEHGDTVRGISPSVIRTVSSTAKGFLRKNPLFGVDDDAIKTASLEGNHSVICAPVVDDLRGVVLAVVYCQINAANPDRAYDEDDLAVLDDYVSAVGRVCALYFQEKALEHQVNTLRDGVPLKDAPLLVGESRQTQELRRLLHRIYIPAVGHPDPEPILLLGEKGTGKDMVARYIHAYSARRSKRLVVLNCAEITDEMASARFFGHKQGAYTGAITAEKGFFRAADGGVLFLDEIGDLSLKAQATLLRVLENRTVVAVGETEERRIDVQVILATNKSIEDAVAAGLLRGDFVDRVRIQTLLIPPLRERPTDIAYLARHFVDAHQSRMRKWTLGLTDDALRALAAYAWPENVRGLSRVCSKLVSHAAEGASLDRALLAAVYPEVLTGPQNNLVLQGGSALYRDATLEQADDEFHRELFKERLERYSASDAARSLGMGRSTFYTACKKLGIPIAREADGEKTS